MLLSFFQGFGVGGGLIVAIGAQNAFVLSQGVKRQYHWLVAFICAAGDISLIALGVTGVGSLVASNDVIGKMAAIGGTVFLFWYGLKAFRSMLGCESLEEDTSHEPSLKVVVLTTLAVTFLNPHVYLDTILLLGSIAGQLKGNGKYIFGLGAMSASVIWFFGLSLGGRFLAPVFKNPMAWKILDGLVGLTMWAIATQLLKSLMV